MDVQSYLTSVSSGSICRRPCEVFKGRWVKNSEFPTLHEQTPEVVGDHFIEKLFSWLSSLPLCVSQVVAENAVLSVNNQTKAVLEIYIAMAASKRNVWFCGVSASTTSSEHSKANTTKILRVAQHIEWDLEPASLRYELWKSALIVWRGFEQTIMSWFDKRPTCRRGKTYKDLHIAQNWLAA